MLSGHWEASVERLALERERLDRALLERRVEICEECGHPEWDCRCEVEEEVLDA